MYLKRGISKMASNKKDFNIKEADNGGYILTLYDTGGEEDAYRDTLVIYSTKAKLFKAIKDFLNKEEVKE